MQYRLAAVTGIALLVTTACHGGDAAANGSAADGGASITSDAGAAFGAPGDAGAPPQTAPTWAAGARMIDIAFHEDFPASPDDVKNDTKTIHALVDAAVDAGASILQFH